MAKHPRKRLKLPNGFGQITKLRNNRLRKPYRAMITVGKNEIGRPICKILKPQGYFETYNDAYAALMKYHENPYDFESDMKLHELFNNWTKEYFEQLRSRSSERSILSAWNYCVIKDMPVREIRARHLKGCINDAYIILSNGEKRLASPNTKSRIKSMFNLMFDYALENEIVDKNYARMFDLSKNIILDKQKATRTHIPFTDFEIRKLWDNIDIPYVDVILIQCYTGFRPQELGLIKVENVDFEQGIIIGGMKTAAGTNRIVPINEKIKEIVKSKYKESKELGSEYLINCTDGITHRNNNKLTYDKYRHRFKAIMNRLHLNEDHRAHDGRCHFITKAKECGLDEYAIKYIVGHAIIDVTEKIYTHRKVEWLVNEMKKLQF